MEAANAKLQAGQTKMEMEAGRRATASFETVKLAAGKVTINRVSYSVTDCDVRIEQGADVRQRGFTLTTGMIGSNKLKGHMYMTVTTPDGDSEIAFKASDAEKAEKFRAAFKRSQIAWKAANLADGNPE